MGNRIYGLYLFDPLLEDKCQLLICNVEHWIDGYDMYGTVGPEFFRTHDIDLLFERTYMLACLYGDDWLKDMLEDGLHDLLLYPEDRSWI